ncbi:hypothetical protein C2S52_021913 [Perilla frutescens var. hirtella]|uniref:BHLH domain-containing protein n=1 Tax=Perilla frutescens var. hirtella TaxID=608512 RepID=A0AAD4ITI9_PERFH|nr:hypothetical protein C2S52_021913 [Perilla frutescens var. hirtella]KAH6807665.1 hypothetical protein C2S51_028773 [Perilla frutescens var. frutescens]KAH6821285.1 hypothetical protein C2S53_016927 [Perilla frutescens var. hirtella]
MSSRRSGRAKSRSFTQDEDEANLLIFKLQACLPADHSTSTTSNKKTSASEILKKTCNYIKKLQKEVDDLSDGLSQRLASGDIPPTDADIIRRLLKL